MKRWKETFGQVLFAGLVGPVAMGLAEGIRANADLNSLWIGLAFCSSLMLPLLCLFSLIALLARLSFGRTVRFLWRDARGRGLSATLCVVGVCWCVPEAAGWTARFVGDRVNDHDLVAPAVSVGVFGFLALSIPFILLLWAPLCRLSVRIPLLGQHVLSCLLLLSLPFLTLYPPAAILAKDVPWDPAILVLVALVVSTVGFLIPLGARRRNMVSGLLILLISISWFLGPRSYVDNHELRALFADSNSLSHLLVAYIQQSMDEDGDGFSSVLGGGDCDDTDATISPFSLEISGNGIDEDCRDGDRPVREKAARKPVKHSKLSTSYKKSWNILIVTIDALRPDHLDLYGYPRETAPTIKMLGQNGLVFQRAYASANATRYTLPTMFAGRNLADLQLEKVGGFHVVTEGNNLLFERLKAGGWETAAHLPYQLKRGMWLGLDRGVDTFKSYKGARLKKFSAGVLAKGVTRHLKRLSADKPWAIWVHILEPHEPYLAHKKYPFGKSLIDKYDAEIRAADEGLARIVRMLKKKGMFENTIIVVTSDHGEEFNEHGRRFHGKQLFEESILVPLIIHVPGAPKVLVETPVSLIDIPETIAHFTGLPPGPDYGGVSLAGLMDGQKLSAGRSIFSDCVKGANKNRRRSIAMITDHRKLIYEPTRQRMKLFDLSTDPDEKKDLRGSPPPIFKADVARFRREIDRQNDSILAQLRNRRIGKASPIGLGKPLARLDGLIWLGGHTNTRVLNGSNMLQIRNWFKATGKPKDYKLKLELVDPKGKVRRTWVYRPLSGQYPTTLLRAGEVLEDARLLRFRKLKGKIKVQMSIYLAKKRVAGPTLIGTAEASTYY